MAERVNKFKKQYKTRKAETTLTDELTTQLYEVNEELEPKEEKEPYNVLETNIEKIVVQPTPQVNEEPKEEPIEKILEIQTSAPVITVEKKIGGRPKKYDENVKNLKIYLPEENYNFIKIHGGMYDGMSGYINHLIEEEIKRKKKENRF